MLGRKVKIFKFEPAKDKDGEYLTNEQGHRYSNKVKTGVGLFHQWGCDYEEFESGAGTYSTAIIEMEDGTVENVPCELVKFIK